MFTRDPGPRPAELLPPTLLPNAVLRAAPHPDRMTSLLAACMVYCALGGALVGTARHIASRPAGAPTLGHTWELVDPDVPRAPVARALPGNRGGGRPEGLKVVQPAADPNRMPEVDPRTLPTENHGLDIAGPADGPGGPAVHGIGPGEPGLPGPAQPGEVRPAAPLEMDVRQIGILRQVAPSYPALARRVKIQGPVVLRMTIDTGGVPTDVQVVSGPHPLLVEEAVRVARLWRFRPAQVNGEAVPATFNLTVAFRLQS